MEASLFRHTFIHSEKWRLFVTVPIVAHARDTFGHELRRFRELSTNSSIFGRIHRSWCSFCRRIQLDRYGLPNIVPNQVKTAQRLLLLAAVTASVLLGTAYVRFARPCLVFGKRARRVTYFWSCAESILGIYNLVHQFLEGSTVLGATSAGGFNSIAID